MIAIFGEMAEWSNAFDLKSNVVKATEGSNPSLSVKSFKSVACATLLRFLDIYLFSSQAYPHILVHWYVKATVSNHGRQRVWG